MRSKEKSRRSISHERPQSHSLPDLRRPLRALAPGDVHRHRLRRRAGRGLHRQRRRLVLLREMPCGSRTEESGGISEMKKKTKRLLYCKGGAKVEHEVPAFLPRYRVARNSATTPGTILEAASLREAEEKIADYMQKYPAPKAEFFIYERMPVVFLSRVPVLTKVNIKQ